MAKTLQDIFQDIHNGQIVDAKEFIRALKDAGYVTGKKGGVNTSDIEGIKKLLKENENAQNRKPSLFFDGLRREINYLKESREEALDAAKEAADKLAKSGFSSIEEGVKKIEELTKKLKDAKDNVKSLGESFNLSKDELADVNELCGLLVDEINAGNKSAAQQAQDIDDIAAAYGLTTAQVTNFVDELKKAVDTQEELNDKAPKLGEAINSNTASIKAQNNSISEGLSTMKKGFSDVSNAAMSIANAWGKIDQAAAKAAKSMGTSAASLASMRKNAIEAVAQGAFASRYGVDGVKLLELQTGYDNTIGRRVSMSALDQENMAALNPIMGEQGAEMAARLENFGLSYSDAGKTATKMFKEAGKYGLSFQKYSENFVKNIHLAQNYTFKNGLKGLESMAKKATAIKLDMGQVASFAEKVSTLEGAVNTGAQLQVLGGPFAMMSDPLGMLNEGLNDMEGLMDRFTKMVGGLGRFDSGTGEIAISSFNKQRIKAAASAMGMDYGQVMESIQAQGRQAYVEKQIADKGYTKEQQEILKNTASVSNGKTEISWLDAAGERHTKDLSKDTLTAEDWRHLTAQNNIEADNIRDIAALLRGWDDVITGGKAQIENARAGFGEAMGMGFVKDTLKSVFDDRGAVNTIAAVTTGFKAVKGLLMAILGAMPWAGSGLGKVGKILGKGGKFLGKAVKKTGLSKIGTKLGNTAAGKAISRAGGRVGATVAKKTGSIALGKLARATVKGGGIGTIASIGGALGDIATENALAKGKMKKGGAGNFFSRIGSGIVGGAGTGAAGGALVGGVGAIPGAIIGGVIGGLNGLKKAMGDKTIGNLEDKFGVKAQGSYGYFKSKKIEKALETGEISDSLRNKLIRNGDDELIRKINEVKEQKIGRVNQTAEVVNINGTEVNGGTTIARAANGGLLEGPSHANGGMPIVGSNIEVEGGEFVVNKKSTAKNLGTLTAINNDKMGNGGIIRPRKMEDGGVVVKERAGSSTSSQTNGISIAPININISGKITLDGGSGNGIDISDEILKDKPFIRKLTRMIEEQIIQNTKGGNIVQKGLY